LVKKPGRSHSTRWAHSRLLAKRSSMVVVGIGLL
jgi:hypothetical protein